MTRLYYACRNRRCEVYREPTTPAGGPCARCGWLRMLAVVRTWAA